MHSKIWSVIAVLPAFAFAYRIPSDLDDGGLYLVHKDEKGNPTKFEAMHNTTDTKRDIEARPRSFANLPSDATAGCSTSILNVVDYQTAISSFDASCDNHATISSGQDIVAPSGGAAAYMCNYGGTNGCHLNEASAAWAALSSSCKQVAGWILINSWAKSYGIDWVNAEICGQNY